MAGEPELKFVVTGDTSSLDAAIARAKGKVGEMRTQLNAGAASFAKWGAAGVAAGGAMAVAITRSAADAGKEIANLSRLSGVSATEFQKLAAASQTVGIQQEKLGDIFKDVRDRVGDFIQTGGGPMADFFERIAPKVGVTTEQFRKLSGPQALQLFVDTMEKAGLSSNEMAFQMEAMASDATALLPLLKNGGATMRELGDEAERTGRILSDIDVARLQLAGQQMAEFDQTVGTLKNQLGAELAPILAGIGKLIEDAAKEAGGFGNLVGNSFNEVIDAAGFVADAIHGIQTVFETVADGLIIGANTIGLALSRPIEDILALAAAVPGVGDAFDGPLRQVEEFRNGLAGVSGEAIDAIHDRLMEPLPSESLKKWVGEVQASADEAAKSLNERLSEASGGQGLQAFSSEEADKEAEKAAAKEVEREKRKQQQLRELAAQQAEQRQMQLADENARRLELFNQRYFGEEELRKEYEERQAELDAARREQGIINEQQFQEFRLQNMREMFNQQLGIQSSGYDALGNLAAKHWNAETSMAIDALGAIVNATAGNSKKMFEVQKALGIANSVISTYTGMSKALELGWPLGPIAAASIAAKGFAQVAAIRSQSFGGGGSVSSGGGGSASLGGGGGGQAQQQQQAQNTQTVFVSGSRTGMISVDQLADVVAPALNKALRNGDNVDLRFL